MFNKGHSKSKNLCFSILIKKLTSLYQGLSALVFSLFLISCISFSFSVNADTIITNTATANFSINGTAQSLSDSVQFTKDTVVTPSDVITLSKQANPTQVYQGDIVAYTLSVDNPNNHVLNNIIIKDFLPVGVNYQTGTAKLNGTVINSSQISYSSNQLTISLGSIPANNTWNITYQARANTIGSHINRAIASSDTATSSQAEASIYTTVRPPTPPSTKPLVLKKEAQEKLVKNGDTIHYYLSISNDNNTTINNVNLQDTLPAGLAFVNGSALFNNKPVNANTTNGLSFQLGAIPAKTQWKLTYEAMVKNSGGVKQLINKALITTHNTQANSNIATASVEVSNKTITINKIADKTQAFADEFINYTIVVKNPEKHDLVDLHIKDILPNGFIYQKGSTKVNGKSLTSASIKIEANTLVFSLGNLSKDKSLSLSYSVKVGENTIPGKAVNQAQASSKLATSKLVSATVSIRTPSTIKFLKINENGVKTTVPPSSYNSNKNGGKNWQEVKVITLPDGSVISLPTPLPLVKAPQYTILDPVIIQVKDLDQNTHPKQIDTIIVTVNIPGTKDKEILLLKETGPNTGIFRGAVLTTNAQAQVQNGLLSIKEGSKIQVIYHDDKDTTDTSATAALVTPDTQLALTKSADKESASIGELVRYTLTIKNASNFTVPELNLTDTLPLGFRFIAGSASLNNFALNKQISSDGRNLNFKLGKMKVGELWTIEYLTKVTSGVQIGKAVNIAYIETGKFKSNKAKASVIIKDDLMRSKNILTGRVYIGCNTGKSAKVLKDARIYNETGRSVLTDKEGFWHMEGIMPGSHVLQIDGISLPSGYEPILCNDNTRHAGNPQSQFVNLQAGNLWHVDFHVKKKASFIENQPDNQNDGEDEPVNPVKLFGKEYLETAPEGFEILWPKNNYVPAIASTKILVKSSPQHKIEVFLNGEKVSPLNYDGSDTNKSRTITIRRWLGVDIDIKNRDNTLLVIAKDKNGKEVARKTHNIHFSGKPASATLLTEKSILIADGQTIPVIALRIKDEDGFPMRANTHGYFNIEDNRYQIKTQNENEDKLNLNESLAGTYKYQINEKGIAKIELNPTTQSGEITLNLKFSKSSHKTIKAWLKPQLREWILVGLAEGTLAHKTLSGNMQALKDLNKSDKFYKDGRVAFFAKGQIKGKYLLTIAYDTQKSGLETGSQLEGDINPDSWYTIYGDNSNSQYNAPSSRKLYLKIEKDNFFALFGDFHTGMNVTELAKYERVLNGIKSEYQGKRFSYNAFISETSNKHHHQEISGDGTSGLYHLSQDILVNSESIRIETRDRFHSERIIETKELVRYQDYEIDYSAGTLFFKFPVTERDQNFNPNIIVVDYDSETDSNKDIVVGGRIAVKTDDEKLEVGLSAIHIGHHQTKDESLIAADATYNISTDTKVHAEIAQSKTDKSQYKPIQAYILEVEKEIADIEARLYYRKQGKNFGIDSQDSESGIQKTGAELSYKLSEKTTLNAELSHQKNLSNNNKRQLAKVEIKHQYKQLEFNTGLRHSKEELEDETNTNNTILLGGKYTTDDGKFTLRSNFEKNINSDNGSELSPDKAILGIDIKLEQGLTLFAEHEITDNNKVTTQNSRVGLSKDLWKGATGKTTYTQERTDEGQRNYATLGLSQQLKLNEKIRADFSIDHAKTIGGNQKQFNSNEPVTKGSQHDDYTAFSVGLGSDDKDWSWTSRFELRDGEIQDKINFRAGVIRHLKDGKNLSAKLHYSDSDNKNGDFETIIKLSLGTAWHPKEEDFVFFSRLDLIDEKSNKSDSFVNETNTHTRKIIHNMHYNQKISKKTQVSVHHGIKHIIDKNKNTKHTATIDTGTIEVRQDISKKWDIGVKGGYLHDWSEKTIDTVAGVSAGVTPTKNAWLEFGYNFEGFDDEDFDNNNYTRQGPYISFRYKFDQDTFKNYLPNRKQTKIETVTKSAE